MEKERRKIKRNLARFVEAGLAGMLVLAALYVPQIWFALRDTAFQGRIGEEALAPLMVAQLNRSYERDINERMRIYMEAYAQEDVNCSSKEIATDNESLWENIGQAESCLLMEVFCWDEGYVTTGAMLGMQPVIESCIQYVLMRKSDGQILLVANDILLDKGDGCRMEMLLDGVDGTVYYLGSEEGSALPRLRKVLDESRAWDWWWVLNNTYYAEAAKQLNEFDEGLSASVSYGLDEAAIEEWVSLNAVVYDPYSGQMLGGDYGIEEEWDKAFIQSNDWVSVFSQVYPGIWAAARENKETFCCLLAFGGMAGSWTMEIEAWDGEDFRYQIRLGLPGIVSSIPDMAGRISLAEYGLLYGMDTE